MIRSACLAASLLVCSAVLGACGGNTTTSTQAPPVSSAAPSGPSGTARTSATPTGQELLRIKDFAFSPGDLTVKVGTTVTATNLDGATHTWTARDGAFDSHALAKGASFSFTFNTPGSFRYVCSIHASMSGTVIVTP